MEEIGIFVVEIQQFIGAKRRNSLSYPGHNVVIFVQWYNNLIKKINKNELQMSLI